MTPIWLTLAQIADLRMPGLPSTKRGMSDFVESAGWMDHADKVRLRKGRGGGLEFSTALLPAETLAWFTARQISRVEEPVADLAIAATEADAGRLNAAELESRDARLWLLSAADKYARQNGLPASCADRIFCSLYDARGVETPDWIRKAAPSISPRTLARWRTEKRKGATARLGVDRGAARRGKGVLETAHGGEVKRFVLGAIAHQPHLSADHLATAISSKFPDLPPVPVRSLQRALKGWKTTHEVALTQITNPDKFKSHFRASARGGSHPVSRVNELWMIDASPADVLTVDGRYSIYLCIDIFTRRVSIYVSKTPRAEAVGLLMRRAIVEWGVPERVKTDNGSDFKAKFTQRLFRDLEIEVDVAAPFSPEQKGHVERAIGTMQRDLMPLLPGFIGHSVADRKVIENRKAFAARLGETDDKVFCVEMTAVDLQAYCDRWANDRYAHRAHDGLQGRKPFDVAASAPGRVRRIADLHALDMLLAPIAGGGGIRRVTKSGIRVDGSHYLTPSVLPGIDVLARMDPADMGRAFLFSTDGAEYLGDAICPELAGVDPAQAIAQARAEQKKLLAEATTQIKKDMRAIKPRDMAELVLRHNAKAQGKLVEFPRASDAHETPSLIAAREARAPTQGPPPHDARAADLQAKMEAEFAAQTSVDPARPPSSNVQRLPVRESKETRFSRALQLEEDFKSGAAVSPEDAHWLGGYQNSAEYRVMLNFVKEFGVAALR